MENGNASTKILICHLIFCGSFTQIWEITKKTITVILLTKPTTNTHIHRHSNIYQIVEYFQLFFYVTQNHPGASRIYQKKTTTTKPSTLVVSLELRKQF